MDFNTVNLHEILNFVFENHELMFYVNFHCSEKNKKLKEFLLGEN